ncbi:MAG: peptidylprolyl isomerase [Sedimentisphaerales bacterium]
MKNFIISALVILAGVFFFGCGKEHSADVDEKVLAKVPAHPQEVNVPAPAGGLVLSVDSTAITSKELIAIVEPQLAEIAAKGDYETFKTEAKTLLGHLLMQKITDIKLYTKAKAALPEGVDEETINKIVEQEVQRFIASYGGNYATIEQMFKKMGTNWKDFREQQKRAILIQSFLSDEVKIDKPITHSELLEHYNSIKGQFYTKEASMQFRVIDLEIDRFADANDPNVSAERLALAKANEIAEKIKSDANFAELAREFSNDEKAAAGGLWEPVRPGSLVEPYDAIEKAAANLTAGQVSEPTVAEGHIFIVKLENRQLASCEPFEKVQQEVEARLILSRRQKMVDDMLKKISAQVDLSYAEDFLNYCVEQAYKEVKN